MLYEVITEQDSWGRTVRRRAGAFFVETLAAPIPEGTDPDSVRFEPPDADFRYLTGRRNNFV